MIYKVLLSMNNARSTPIFSHYRPDWKSENKPEYNCAQVLLNDRDMLFPGESCECKLQPAITDLWKTVQVGEVLYCMEGLKEVGTAVVISIEDKDPHTLYVGPSINMQELKYRRFNIK